MPKSKIRQLIDSPKRISDKGDDCEEEKDRKFEVFSFLLLQMQ